jgi:uncharacterized phage protein (TIGR01671 family)
MRPIKFRGKRIDNGEWAYGSYLHQYWSSKHEKFVDAIVWMRDGSQKRDVVDPESVGQFTGLQDTDSKEIYEGDIVEVLYNGIGNFAIAFYDGRFSVADYNWRECRVIGNIHKNPELLKR